MKNLIKYLSVLSFTLGMSLVSFADSNPKKVAVVKLKRGSVEAGLKGTIGPISKGKWLREGSVIKTGARSFVKLSFIDKSSMNIGPNSEVIIEKFDSKEAGVINVISGKIRSQVTKNYLDMEKDKSKLFVKSSSAVMGIRGTDFMFSTSKQTGATTAILFEGSVVFNKLNASDRGKKLESIVNKGRRIYPGQFSIAKRRGKKVTVPSKLSSKQFFKLEKNKNLKSDSVDKKVKVVSHRSIVPPGLSGADIKSEINLETKSQRTDFSSSKGFRDGDNIKPADGSLVHIESGTVIPMGGDSHFDSNTNEWQSSSNGGVDSSGEYIPPVKHVITDKGELIRLDPATGERTNISTDVQSIDTMPAFNDIPGTKIEDQEAKEGTKPPTNSDNSTQLKAPPTAQDCDTCNRPGSIYNPAKRLPGGNRNSGKTTRTRFDVR